MLILIIIRCTIIELFPGVASSLASSVQPFEKRIPRFIAVLHQHPGDAGNLHVRNLWGLILCKGYLLPDYINMNERNQEGLLQLWIK